MELLGTFDEQFSSLAPVIFYLIVGAIVFIETGLLFGFFLPGDSVLFTWELRWRLQGLNLAEEGYRDWETDRKSTRLNSSHRL